MTDDPDDLEALKAENDQARQELADAVAKLNATVASNEADYFIRSACPTCGVVADRQTYDIGSGPELSCNNCEWCWGALGQDLKPLMELEISRGPAWGREN